MKAFDILRKVRRGYTQENWTICVAPIKVLGRDLFLHKIFVNGSALKKTIYSKYEDYSLGDYGVFVTKYNGVSLFSGSFNVFGYNFSATEAKFKPMDIGVENGILRRHKGSDDRLYIASLGDYLFSIKKGEESVYCTKKGSAEDLYKWQGFDEFFVYVYKSLVKLYGADGLKITPTKSKFPEVVNRTLDMQEVFDAHKIVEEEEKALGIVEEQVQEEENDDDLLQQEETLFEEESKEIEEATDTEEEELTDEVDLSEIKLDATEIFN